MEDNAVTVVTDGNYKDTVENAGRPILLAVGAAWCPDCQRIAPFFMKFAEKFSDKLIFARCDFDTNEELKKKLGVTHIPTIFLIKNGKITDKLLEPKEVPLFKAFVEKALS